MERLSYKMLVEEPGAAGLISTALNKGHEAACKTSELTALAVLSGEVTLRAEETVNQEVKYETIKAKLRGELEEAPGGRRASADLFGDVAPAARLTAAPSPPFQMGAV